MLESNLRLSLALLLFASVRFSNAACYSRNGTQITSQDYQPCNSLAGATSMCCATNAAGRDYPDLCLPSGVCAGGPDSLGARIFYRESCTDPTWKDPACLQLCNMPAYQLADAQLTICNDQTVCCGVNNFTCCNAGDGAVFNVFAAVSSSSASTTSHSSTTSSPTSSQTSTSSTSSASASPITSSSPTKHTSLSTGAIAAIVLGVLLGLIALLSAALYFLHRRQNKRLPLRFPMAETNSTGVAELNTGTAYDPHKPIRNLLGQTRYEPYRAQQQQERLELQGNSGVHELHSNSR